MILRATTAFDATLKRARAFMIAYVDLMQERFRMQQSVVLEAARKHAAGILSVMI